MPALRAAACFDDRVDIIDIMDDLASSVVLSGFRRLATLFSRRADTVCGDFSEQREAARSVVGQTLNHYRIVSALGKGGMGEVFVAEDTKLNRRVALKLLAPRLASNPHYRERFRREAKAVAALSHPNVVTIFSVEESDGIHFLTMELLNGASLAQVIPSEGLPTGRLLDIAIQVADALTATHDCGIIHRDLKPQNIIESPEGRVKVLDFGLARIEASPEPEDIDGAETPLTRESVVLGTAAYMSPEQARGKRVDHRSDIFSLGIILYEMAVGERPFKGRSKAELLSSLLRDAPISPTELKPELPESLGRLISRCLEKDLDHRPRATSELREALVAIRDGDAEVEALAIVSPDHRRSAVATEIRLPSWVGVAEGARLASLLVSELVGSSALLERAGDAANAALSRKHDRLARDLLEKHGGLEIGTTDGLLLLFDRPWPAALYALDYHRALAELCAAEGVELAARVGIHLGEVILRRNPPRDVALGAKPLEVDGLAKPMATRLMSAAGRRQTLMTHAAFDLARRSAVGSAEGVESLRWLAHGRYLFTGIEEPVEVFEVGVGDVAPLAAPESSQQVTRVVDEETILGWRPAPSLAIPGRPNWIVVEKLGEGGFGEVWLGQHCKTGERRVYKFCYEAERLRSLQREITVFRLLKEELGLRDDIVRIVDWNLDEAPYFIDFVHVEGGNLVDWAATRGGLAALPMADRLEIVAQVATALAAAHSVGVLHKDVKPANVLMRSDAEGRPQAVLTDFGIGLVTDRERLKAKGITMLGMTEVGAADSGSSAAGTQMYRAPELLAGQRSTIQADIFALGVMLYQAVVADFERPLAQGWMRDVHDELLREDIASMIDGSPALRPGSATEVAERLRTLDERRAARDAERRAVHATERALRRRRLLTTVAAISSVFLVVVSLLAVQAIRARSDAERRRGQAEQLIDFMLTDLHEGLDKIGKLSLLEGAARTSQEYFDSLSARDASPEDLYKRGLTLLNIGDVLVNQGDTEAALATERSALTLFEDALARDPARADLQYGRGLSHLRLGDVLANQGDPEAALVAYRASLDQMERLVASDIANRDYRYAAIKARYKIAGLRLKMGNEQLDSLREVVTLAEHLTAGPGEFAWRHWAMLLEARTRVATLLRFKNQLDASAVEFRAARQLAERLVVDDPGNVIWNRHLAWIYFQAGVLQFEQRQLSAALDSFTDSRAAYERLIQSDPTRVERYARLAEALRMAGMTHAMLDQPESALKLYREALPLLERLAADDTARLAWLEWLGPIHTSLGSVHLTLGDAASALESFEAARAMAVRILEASGPTPLALNTVAENLVGIGNAHALCDERVEARSHWLRALELAEQVTAQSRVTYYLDTHVKALLQLDRVDEARPMVEELVGHGWNDSAFLDLVREKGLAARLP